MSTPTTEGYPLSIEQRLIWASHLAGRARPLQALVRIEGALDLDALSSALGELVARHEILRTRLWRSPTLKAPLQVVDARAPSLPLAVESVDLSSEASEMERTERLAGFARVAAQQSIDPTEAPHLGALAIRLSAQQTDLLLTASPFCADGTSFEHLTRQLAVLYTLARTTGAPSGGGSEDGIVQYADYAAWQEQQLSEQTTAEAQSYWAGLADVPMTTIHARQAPAESHPLESDPLESDPLESDLQTAEPLSMALPQELMRELRAVGERADADLRSVLLAAWATWIWRVTRESRIVIASVVDGRDRDADLHESIGPFSRWLPVGVEIDAQDTFATVIVKVREADVRARELQGGLGFEALPEGAERALLFELSESDVTVSAGSSLSMHLERTSASPFASALGLRCVLDARELRVELTGDERLGTPESLARVAAQLRALLDAAAKNPEANLSGLSLGDPRDGPSALTADEPAALADAASIAHAFAAQAGRTPERLALVYGEDTLTYSQLEERANRLANVLRDRGVAPGTLVGVCVERGLDMVVAVLGALKASAAYVPLDPSTLNPGRPGYPPERLAFMLEDSGVPLLVAHRVLADGLPALGVKVLAMDDPGLLQQASPDAPELVCTQESIAYAIYTSGSTGRPKAVAITHRSALNLWRGLRREVYGVRAAEHLRVSLNAPLGFDPSVQQLLALIDGHTVVIVPEEIRADGRALLELVDRHEVDVWDCTPPQLRLLVRAGLLASERTLPALVLCGGEAVDRATWTAVAQAPGPQVFNLYGPTECTVDSTLAPMRGERPTIGRPLGNVRAYILNDSANPVPVGVAGELYIGGAGVARGYLNRPALTAERFMPDPFAEHGSRMYRTGDLARMEADGTIEFIGRLDDQVKVRSHRIELGEVAAALGRCRGVRESIVTTREDGEGELRIVAYYLADGDVRPTSSDLRAALKEWLPEYMLPSAFVALDSFPLTANGKVDRRALPAPTHSRPALNVEFVRPRDSAERQFAEIWAQVLDLDTEEIGVLDDFFDDLSGDSLRAVDLVNRLEALIERELPLDFVVHSPTVQEQAAQLREESPALR